jgi:hypothetical protein
MLEFQDGECYEWQASQLFTWTCTNQTTSSLLHNLSTFGAYTNHGQTWTHKTHHSPDLGEATTFLLIIFSMFGHGACTQMPFCPETPMTLEGAIMFCVDSRLKWGLKKSCNPCWKLSNGMWYTTYTQVNQGDYWLLVVKSQIGNLFLGLSFGHNLCFKSSNGSYDLVLDIYVPKVFQWYNELFNPMNFDPWNLPMKIQDSMGTSIPKVGAHLGVWGVHSLTLSYTPKSMKCDSQTSLLVIDNRIIVQCQNFHKNNV